MSGPLYTGEQGQIRESLKAVGAVLKDDNNAKQCCDPVPSAPTGGPTSSTCEWAPNLYQLIQDRIDYHNKSSNELWALYRALPRELPHSAANALATILLDARSRY